MPTTAGSLWRIRLCILFLFEKNVHCVLESFLRGNVQAMERILPLQLARVKNCNNAFFPAAAHVLIGLWYRDGAILEWAVPDAERFMAGKKTPPFVFFLKFFGGFIFFLKSPPKLFFCFFPSNKGNL